MFKTRGLGRFDVVWGGVGGACERVALHLEGFEKDG